MNKNIKFVEKRNFWLFISIIIVIIGFSFMGIRLLQSKPILNYGIDFIGGNTFHLHFTQLNNPENTPQHISNIRNILKPFKLEKSQIQFAENNEVFIKTTAIEEALCVEISFCLKFTKRLYD